MIEISESVDSSFGQINGLVVITILVIIVVSLALRTVVRPRGFPPGPRGLPIVGSIFSMTDSPEIIFANWAKLYGDIYGFKVGERWMVVLNRQEAIKEALLKQGLEFAGRPHLASMEVFTGGYKDIVFQTYSDSWKLHRKLGHSALRQFASGKRLDNLVHAVFPKFQKALEENDNKPVDPKLMITLLLYNLLSAMTFGGDYSFNDPRVLEWKKLMEDATELFGLGLAADFFSWAKYVPTSGPRIIKQLGQRFIDVVRPQVESHKKKFNPDDVTDFIGLMLLAQKEAEDEKRPEMEKLTDAQIVHTVMDIFTAGVNTSTDTLYWALACMAEYVDIQCKVRAEIDRVIGRDHFPVIEDRGSLPYTEATLYEVMRFSSILPIAVPHATMCDVNFRGYRIPKDTWIIINTHSMHFDPQEWDDPESFKPEHFLDDTGTVRQHPSSFLPFSAGRRSCLGEAVAKADLFLIFTWLLQNYTFSKVSGKENESLLNVIPLTLSGRILKSYEIIIKKRDEI